MSERSDITEFLERRYFSQEHNVPVSATYLPEWAVELITLYESNAVNQFVLYGNVNDRIMMPSSAGLTIGGLMDFLMRVLMPRFDVILSYDVGNGIRVEKGNELFAQWPTFKQNPDLQRTPRAAVETLTHYFRYTANLARLGQGRQQVGCVIKSADLLAPSLSGGLLYDLNALAALIRDWAQDSLLAQHSLATFLITENINDMHPLIVNNPRSSRIKIPLPSSREIAEVLSLDLPKYPNALFRYKDSIGCAAEQLAGTTLSSVETLLKTSEYEKKPITPEDLATLKKEMVEQNCNGLIDFIESKRTFDDLYGLDRVKAWLRQDIALWQNNDLAALPMGYLLCGPVGTGKTFLVECLAGEAGVPIVKLKNFRDKWVGSTEGNLEKIFRLLKALSRCYVFVDEADQALGRRDANAGDSGVSGRIYSMLAAEMSNTSNRGRVVWILASSRPDLIEVDLKRPGRIDVKIPIFPTTTPQESYRLIATMCKRKGLKVPAEMPTSLRNQVPSLLTPGGAETLAVKVYRISRTTDKTPVAALRECLKDYQNPIPADVMEFQIQLAAQEASDLDFVPKEFRVKA